MNTDPSFLSADSTIKEAVECWYYRRMKGTPCNKDKKFNKYMTGARESIVYHINPVIGSLKIKELDHDALVDFCTEVLWDGSTFARLQHTLSVLYRTFDMLYESNIISENNISKHFVYRCAGTEHVEFSEEQIISFLRLAQNDVYRSVFCLLMFTDISPEECICLKWRDIDFDHNEVHIRRRALDIGSNHITVPVFYRDLRKIDVPEILMRMLNAQLIFSIRACMFGKRESDPFDEYVFLNTLGVPLSIGSLFSHTRTYLFMLEMSDASLAGLIHESGKIGITAKISSVLENIMLYPPYKKVFQRGRKDRKDELR